MLITITYFDGITIWDYGAGVREISIPGQEILTLEDTGDWVASARFEWPVFGPIPEQGEAQYMASGLLGAPESQLVGYEVIAGVDTIRVGYFPADGEWFEASVDSDGLVMRLIITTGDLSDLTAMTWIWNVETLDAVLEGPLPPGL